MIDTIWDVLKHGAGFMTTSRHKERVYQWLARNTLDEPGESHLSTTEIAVGARLSEERVREVCRLDLRIHQSTRNPNHWSVWRAEPESIYEKRGILTL